MPPLSLLAVKPSYIRTMPEPSTAAPMRIEMTVRLAFGQTSSAMPTAIRPSAPSSRAGHARPAAAAIMPPGALAAGIAASPPMPLPYSGSRPYCCGTLA